LEGYLYYRKGCEIGFMESCGNYILPFKLGVLPGTPSEPEDPDMVGPFYDAFAEGCSDGTQDLTCASMGLMFEFGFLVRKDLPRAVSIYEAGCRRSVGISCALLGLLFLETEATSNQGKAYLNKAQRINPEIDWIQHFLN
jgi:TPR repeat protein